MPDAALAAWFRLFNEVGIVNQLARALFEARLPPGVTVDHYTILNHLVRVRDGRTPLDLARAFQTPKTTITHRLAGLEARGWVTLAPNPKDGRSKRVWLTEAGRAFRDQAILPLGADIAAFGAGFEPAQIAALAEQLATIRTALDRYRDPGEEI